MDYQSRRVLCQGAFGHLLGHLVSPADLLMALNLTSEAPTLALQRHLLSATPPFLS